MGWIDGVNGCQEPVCQLQTLHPKQENRADEHLHVIQDRPAFLSDIILEHQVENFEVVDHMTIWQIELRHHQLPLRAITPIYESQFTCI